MPTTARSARSACPSFRGVLWSEGARAHPRNRPLGRRGRLAPRDQERRGSFVAAERAVVTRDLLTAKAMRFSEYGSSRSRSACWRQWSDSGKAAFSDRGIKPNDTSRDSSSVGFGYAKADLDLTIEHTFIPSLWAVVENACLAEIRSVTDRFSGNRHRDEPSCCVSRITSSSGGSARQRPRRKRDF